MKHYHIISLWLAVLGLAAINSPAQTVIGSWQTGQAEGWYDSSNGKPITDPSNAGKYSFVTGAVPGYAQSLQITDPGYKTDLQINLNTVGGDTAAFLANSYLTFTFSVPAWNAGGYSQMAGVLINAQGIYQTIPWSDAMEKGDTGANSAGGEPNFYFWNGVPMQTQTVTIDYASYVSSVANGGLGWVELSFTECNGGGAPGYYFLNNVVLSTGPYGAESASPPPTMGIQQAKPELRIFAGSSVDTYDREELDAVDQNQSWIWPGVNYPVTYSFSLLDFPVAPGMQCQIFLIPTKFIPSGNTPTGNQFVDYQSSNELWLTINGLPANPDGSSGYFAEVAWKTNNPNANPNILALANGNGVVNGIYTNTGNQSPAGTWTLRFNSATTGTLTPPGVASLPFTITDPNVMADFANPVLAVFGLQPNAPTGGGTANEGTYIDYAAISVTGVEDGAYSEDFVHDLAAGNTTITSSGLWDTSDSAAPASVQLVNTNTPLWVTWTTPAIGWGLGVSPNLPITQPPGYTYSGPSSEGSFVLPQQFNGYYDTPVTVNQGGTNWTLIPGDCLPSGATPPVGTNAFFQLVSPPPPN
jgi:hypothetical protein